MSYWSQIQDYVLKRKEYREQCAELYKLIQTEISCWKKIYKETDRGSIASGISPELFGTPGIACYNECTVPCWVNGMGTHYEKFESNCKNFENCSNCMYGDLRKSYLEANKKRNDFEKTVEETKQQMDKKCIQAFGPKLAGFIQNLDVKIRRWQALKEAKKEIRAHR